MNDQEQKKGPGDKPWPVDNPQPSMPSPDKELPPIPSKITVSLQEVMAEEIILEEKPQEPVKQEPVKEVVVEEIVNDDVQTPSDSESQQRKPQNLTVDSQLSFDNGNKPGDIYLPGDTYSGTRKSVNDIPNVNIIGTNKSDEWAEIISSSLNLTSFEDTFLSTLESPKADFHQTMLSNNTRFGSSVGKFPYSENTKYEGEPAILRTMAILGMGSTFTVALPNTGLWLTLKPPSEEGLVELYRQMTSDIIKMGRRSYGLVFANSSSFIHERIGRFILDHIYRVHAKQDEINVGNVLSFIKTQDITSLFWGFACTMYPRGFNYSRACVGDPVKCKHITNETLNIHKLQEIDRNALTERQNTHMLTHRTSTSLTIKDLKLYESDMVRASSHRFVINEGEKDEIAFTLRSPSFTEYVESGHRWIDDIVSTVEKALEADASPEERNTQIDLRSRATLMRQYSHWVGLIEMKTMTVDDRTTIESVLGQISGNQLIRETFLENVKTFIETSSVAVVGIPTYDCPVCGQANEGPTSYPHRATMIPIDVVQLFFALLTRKHWDLTTREI